MDDAHEGTTAATAAEDTAENEILGESEDGHLY
jgi:hypothetical protein